MKKIMNEEVEIGENGEPLNFSQRMGLAPKRKEIQINGIDEGLSNRLWSILVKSSINPMSDSEIIDLSTSKDAIPVWETFCKNPIHLIPQEGFAVTAKLFELWSTWNWTKKLELVEFCVDNLKYSRHRFSKSKIIRAINKILEEEYSGFRLVNNQLVPITSSMELEAIETAIDSSDEPVANHITTAAKSLSDRDNPEYGNSIKESISAVEAALKIHLKNPTGSLGAMLGKLPEGLDVPTPLVEGWKKLYGWTSGPNGIRHSQSKGEMKPDFAEAQYMLVTCSAFVNYLKLKFAE